MLRLSLQRRAVDTLESVTDVIMSAAFGQMVVPPPKGRCWPVVFMTLHRI